jgi:hypothetical protein
MERDKTALRRQIDERRQAKLDACPAEVRPYLEEMLSARDRSIEAITRRIRINSRIDAATEVGGYEELIERLRVDAQRAEGEVRRIRISAEQAEEVYRDQQFEHRLLKAPREFHEEGRGRLAREKAAHEEYRKANKLALITDDTKVSKALEKAWMEIRSDNDGWVQRLSLT